jgi:hypothetical protein
VVCHDIDEFVSRKGGVARAWAQLGPAKLLDSPEVDFQGIVEGVSRTSRSLLSAVCDWWSCSYWESEWVGARFSGKCFVNSSFRQTNAAVQSRLQN